MLSEQKTADAQRDFDEVIQSRMRIFTPQEILTIGSGFVIGLVLLNIMVRFIRNNLAKFDCPTYWPISIFYVRDWLTWKHGVVVVAVLAFFHLGMGYLMKIRKTSTYVKMAVIIGIILLLGTNLIQGWEMGFVHPIAPPGSLEDSAVYNTPARQLYHDALLVEDVPKFIGEFENIQEGLGTHGRVHPPGAVLLIYYLKEILGSFSVMSISIAIVSAIFSALFLFGILRKRVNERLAGFMILLYLLIPSVQIYYAATMDAVVATFLLGALFFFLQRNPVLGIAGTVFFLFLALFLTFLAVFIFPVFFGFDLVKRKNIWRSTAILTGLILLFGAVYVFADYNYLHSFQIASAIDNPYGFWLLSKPINYAFTRLEGICEILLFFGPFLGVLMLRGLHLKEERRADLQILAFWGIGTLLAMFATGTFQTGETARVCLFILPYLLFPVALYLKHVQVTKSEQFLILHLVFLQSVIMQIIGNYWW